MFRRLALLAGWFLLFASLAQAGEILHHFPREAVRKMTGTLQVQTQMKLDLQSGKRTFCTPALLPRGNNSEALSDMLVFVHTPTCPEPAQLAELEKLNIRAILADWIPPMENHPDGFFLAQVPLEMLDELALLPWVSWLGSGEQALFPHNDLAAQGTGAIVLRDSSDFGVTGAGVRVGVFDSGLDVTHADFPEPVVAVDYSAWPDSDFVVTNTVTGHGTHTAGTVLGRGVLSGGKYSGMAPDAELVFIKIGDDAEALETSAGVAHSYIAATDYYNCDITSMSYGFWNDFLDGSMEMEQAVDYASEQGVLVFCSAGNSAQNHYHFSDTLAADASSEFIPLSIHSNPDSNFVLINLVCVDDADTSIHSPFSLKLYYQNMDSVSCMLTEQVQSPRGTESRILISDNYQTFTWDTWYVQVTNESGSDLTYHLYLNLQEYIAPENWSTYSFVNADPMYTVGAPAIADQAIAVAAYTTRTVYMDYLGEVHDMGGYLEDLAYFSSMGPRVDGVQKPEVAAPGRYLVSCRDQDVVQMNTNFDRYILTNPPDSIGVPADYYIAQGTSMACPAAAGTAALLLENVDPEFHQDIRGLLLSQAREDEFTGTTPNDTWGYGKLDGEAVWNAFHTDIGESGNDFSPQQFRLERPYPNPFNNNVTIRFQIPSASTLLVEVYDVLGRKVQTVFSGRTSTGFHQYNIDLSQHAGGVYFVHARTNTGHFASRRIVHIP